MTDDLVAKLRDEDSYYRLQEKHWCIDAEELERQRLAAADRIEALEAKLAEKDALLRECGEALAEYACHGGPDLPCIRSKDQCRTECGKTFDVEVQSSVAWACTEKDTTRD